ncbi:MAG: DUF2339 domain-containing protein, partial [Pseudomonadota bacterium]
LSMSAATPGDPAPLPWLPLLNPFDAVTALWLVGTVYWWRAGNRGGELTAVATALRLPYLLAAAALLVTSVAVARGVHQVTEVPWSLDAIVRSVAVRAALSIFWGSVAAVAMTIGARRSLRPVWFGGAALMGLACLQLVIIALEHSATVAGFVSFLVIGALLLLIGYLAPAPPRPHGAASTPGDATHA